MPEAPSNTSAFFDRPILNSPYEYPARHWALDDTGQPTGNIMDRRRGAEFVTPIPKPKKRKPKQTELLLHDDETNPSAKTAEQINELRYHVDAWRKLPNPNDWRVTPVTASERRRKSQACAGT